MGKNKRAKQNKKEKETPKENRKNAPKSSAELIFEASLENVQAHGEGGYFAFLLNAIRRTSPYKRYSKVNDFFKPFIFIMRFFRILFVSVAWIQASALLLIAAVAALVILPILLFFLFIIALIIRINLKYKKAEMNPCINNKDVVVFFRGRDFSRFFFENVCDFAKKYTVVIVVSCPIRDLKRKNMLFLNFEIISENIVVMHEHCYFSIRKRLLKQAKRLIYVF